MRPTMLVVVALYLGAQCSAFSAGRVPVAYSVMSSAAHETIEDALAAVDAQFYSDAVRKQIYFGNWLRDYSQIMDPGGLAKLSRHEWLKIINYFARKEFGLDPSFLVTRPGLGVYRPEEHIDNPYGWDGVEAVKADPELRGAISPQEYAIDPTTGMKAYIASEHLGIPTSKGYIRQTLSQSIQHYRLGNHHEAFRLLGSALHVIEDFYAHTNFIELTMIQLGYTHVFPWVGLNVRVQTAHGIIFPVVTGTFGSADFAVSILSKMRFALDGSDNYRLQRRHVESDKESHSDLQKRNWLEAIVGVPMQLLQGLKTIAIDAPLRLLMSFVAARMEASVGNKVQFINAQFFADPYNTNPSHAQISKDRYSHPLNPVAGECAKFAVKRVGKVMLGAYRGGDPAAAVESALKFFVHPGLSADPDVMALIELIGQHASRLTPDQMAQLTFAGVQQHQQLHSH